MAYAASNTGPAKRGADSEPSGKGTSKQYSAGAGSAGCKGEPSSSGGLNTPKMTSKGNARKA